MTDSFIKFSPELKDAVSIEAEKYRLPIALVAAIVMTESSGSVLAFRFEPHYRYLWNVAEVKPFRPLTSEEAASSRAPADFPYPKLIYSRDSEWVGQKSSWGPMQLMGAVARERGFTGGFPALCSAAVGVSYGCAHLANYARRYLELHGWEGVAAAYNAGSPRRDDVGRWVNQQYVDKIRARGGFPE